MSESTDQRLALRRATDMARRLRMAADRTAGTIGALTAEPKTPYRASEFRRLSTMLDELIVRAAYWEKEMERLK